MNVSTPASPVNAAPPVAAPVASAAEVPKLDEATAFAALGNPIRWRAVQMMALGEPVTATEVAAVVQKHFNTVSKHLRILREAGVVAGRAGEDRRMALFHIPQEFRPQPGVVDYGFCVLRFTSPSAGRIAKD